MDHTLRQQQLHELQLYKPGTPGFARQASANRYAPPSRPETPSRAIPRDLNRKPSSIAPSPQWTGSRPTAPRVQSKPASSVVGRSPAPNRATAQPQLVHRVSFNASGSTTGSSRGGNSGSLRTDSTKPVVASKLSQSSNSVKLAPPRQSSVARLYSAELYSVPEPEDPHVIARIRTPKPAPPSRSATRTPVALIKYPTPKTTSGHKHVVVAFTLAWDGYEEVSARILLDPGASVALISKAFVRQFAIPTFRRDHPITIFDLSNRPVPDAGDSYTQPLILRHQYHWTAETFEVAAIDERIDAILPLEWMDKHELVPLHSGEVYFGSALCMQRCTKKQILKDQEAAANPPSTPRANKSVPTLTASLPKPTSPVRNRVPSGSKPALPAAKPLKLLLPPSTTKQPIHKPRTTSAMGHRPAPSTTPKPQATRKVSPPASTVSRPAPSQQQLAQKKSSIFAQPTRRSTMPVGRQTPAPKSVTAAPQPHQKALVRATTNLPSSTALRKSPTTSSSSGSHSDDYEHDRFDGYDSSASSEFDEHPRSGYPHDRRHHQSPDEID